MNAQKLKEIADLEVFEAKYSTISCFYCLIHTTTKNAQKLQEMSIFRGDRIEMGYLAVISCIVYGLALYTRRPICHAYSRTVFLLGLGYYMHDYILYLSISFYLFTQTHTQHKPT